MTWDPAQYRRFAAERAQPFWDLADLVETDRPIRRAVDLGCGSGELTVELAPAPAASVSSSASTRRRRCSPTRRPIAVSPSRRATSPDGRRRAITTSCSPTPACNGCPTIRPCSPAGQAALGDGGQLAVQVPANADHASHLVAAEVGASEPFASAMGGEVPPDRVAVNVLRPEEYAVLLHDLGFARQHVRLAVYGHVLDDTAAVAEWVRGTSLTRFFAVLPEELARARSSTPTGHASSLCSGNNRRTSTRSSAS